jgi:hypothetical protein
MSLRPLLLGVTALIITFGRLALPVAAPVTWMIDPKPLLDIGADGGDTLETFGEVVSTARLPNGDIVIADGKDLGLRYFPASGKFLRTVGRRGNGPGEFNRIIRMLHCGDSLLVMQSGGIWSTFSQGGVFARTFKLEMPAAGSQYPYNVRCNRAGQFINHDWGRRPTEATKGNFRPTVPFWLANHDGSIKTRLGDFPSEDRFTTIDRDGNPSGDGPLPLGKTPVLGLGTARAYVGTADSFQVSIYDLNGKLVGAIHKPGVLLRTTPADIERYWMLDTAGKSDADKAMRLRIQAPAKFPPTVPAYQALLVDSEEQVWIRSYPRPGDRVSHWSVFSPTGVEVAGIDLPTNLTVTEVGRDWVLGIALELPDGVNHVKEFRLHRGGGGR